MKLKEFLAPPPSPSMVHPLFLIFLEMSNFSGDVRLADVLRFHGPIKRLRLDSLRRSGSVGPEPV